MSVLDRTIPPTGLTRCMSICLVAVVVSAPTNRSLRAQQMIYPGNTWETATPESVLVDSQKLQGVIDRFAQTVNSVEELMVVRNGRVIWQGNNVDFAQHVYSVTKSFTSTALGLLIDDGIVTLDTPVKEFVPALADEYPDATFRHFVTFTSGYLAVDETIPLDNGPPPQDPFAPAPPLFSPPGSQFAYTGTAMDMLANALTRAAGQPLQELFTKRIADPIGMDSSGFDWRGFVASDGVVVDGGSGYDDRGIVISASNAARFGHLFLNNGDWGDQQLISAQWVDEVGKVQVPSTIPLHPKSATGGPGSYSFGWWTNVFSPEWFEALGYLNNTISVDQVSGFVVARLGTEANTGYGALLRELVNATLPAVWDENGDGRWTESDPVTNVPRWRTEDGAVPDIYPTARAVIRSNQVSIEDDLGIRGVTIESGAIVVAESGRLRSSSTLKVEKAGRFAAFGPIAVETVAVDGGRANFDGSGTVDRIIVRSGSVDIGAGASLRVGQLNLINGNVSLAGDLEFDSIRLTGGSIQVYDSQSPYDVTKQFRSSGKPELTFVVTDESWDSPLNMVDGVVPTFAGKLALEMAPTFDPKQLEGQVLNLFDWSDGVVPANEFDQVVHSARFQTDLSQLYVTGEIKIDSVLDKPTTAGDFNGDSVLDARDVDDLTARMRVDSSDGYYDVNGDGAISQPDLKVWVHDLKQTWFGDANLDGEFNSSDLVDVLASGTYGLDVDSTWSQGDFDGNGHTDASDLVVALGDGGYTGGGNDGLRPPEAALAVPEPSNLVGLLVGLLLCRPSRAVRFSFECTGAF